MLWYQCCCVPLWRFGCCLDNEHCSKFSNFVRNTEAGIFFKWRKVQFSASAFNGMACPDLVFQWLRIEKKGWLYDWQTTFEFFDSMWGSQTINRFVSVHNAKLHRFHSLYWYLTTEAVEAFFAKLAQWKQFDGSSKLHGL